MFGRRRIAGNELLATYADRVKSACQLRGQSISSLSSCDAPTTSGPKSSYSRLTPYDQEARRRKFALMVTKRGREET